MKTKYKIVKEHTLLPSPGIYDSISNIRGNIEQELRSQGYIEEIEVEDGFVDKFEQLKFLWRQQSFAEMQNLPFHDMSYGKMKNLENEIIRELSLIDSQE